jgi:hypothetical protein
LPEPARFYASLLLSPLTRSTAAGRWRLTALLSLAQLATLAGALREVFTRR